jgi:NTP-dependent ternary system trypsin peptidase co-occuring protein
MMAAVNVRVETVELDSAGTRQIGSRHRTTALLRDRRGDIEAAVREACEIVQDSVTKVDARQGWRVSSVEAKFGLIIAAEAGVILSRASAEASFEVTVTIEHA